MPIHLHGLRTAIYLTHDLDAAKQWYTNAFGVAPYFDEPFYVGFNIGGYELGLHPRDSAAAPVGVGVTAYWGVDDVPAAFAHLVAAGAIAIEEPSEVGGGIIVASVFDPWGNALGFIFNPHFSL